MVTSKSVESLHACSGCTKLEYCVITEVIICKPWVKTADSPRYKNVPRAACPMYIFGPRAVSPEYKTVLQGRQPWVHFCTLSGQP